MAKRLLVVFLAMMITAQLSGCSSGGNKGEDGQEVAQQDGADDFGQQSQQGLQTADGQAQDFPQDGQDLAGQQTAIADAQAGGGGDLEPQLSLDDQQGGGLPEDIAAGTADPAAQPPKQQTAKGGDLPPPVADNSAPMSNDAAAAPTDEPLFKPQDGGGAPADTGMVAGAEPPPAPKKLSPLQKVKESAFDKNGTNLNRVYIAREGESMKSISQKLYGKNREKDLKAWNPGSKAKPGDKIYYQSPTNPDDTKMLTFYEEQGVQPEIYTTQRGDTLAKLSKNWLGNKDSWKELWSTNFSLGDETKYGKLPDGLEIKYWPTDAMAKAAPPAEPPKDMAPPMPDPMTPPQNMAANDIPPPPPPPPAPPLPASTPDNGAAAGMVEPPPPPPPPPPINPEQPKVPKPPKAVPVKADADADQDTMMMMGLGGILLMAAAVLFVLLRRNRAKRIDLGQTQV